MRKLLLLLFASIFLLNLVAAIDVAYILKNTNYPNDNFIASLDELNLTYDLIDDSEITITNFDSYDMILIGDENFGSLATSIPINQKNALFLAKSHVDEWKWASSIITISSSQTIKGRILINNSITKDFSSPVTLTTSAGSYYVLPKYPSRPYSIDNVISTDNFDKYPILALVIPGDVLKGGVTSNSRGLYFGITNTDNWNSNSKEIFKRAVYWVLYGEDRDGDGFFSDEDCDDNNALVNPNAEEIPYDGLDNDCVDGDLIDVDEDGFDAEIAGGNDCNDDDALINPDAEEIIDNIDQNCVNDAPVLLSEIEDLSWDEDEQTQNIPSINLDDYFADPEGDDLDYSVYDTSSNLNITIWFTDNIVTFSVNENWYGEDWIIFKADDGNLEEISNNIILTVNPINDAPVLDNIEDIYIVEGSLIKIIPNANDIENDDLIYSFSAPLNSEGEWQTEIGNAGVYSVNISVSDGILTDSKEVKINVISKLVINEFESNDDGEWVEIYNPKQADIDISNWEIWDGLSNPHLKYKFGTQIIPADSYIVVNVDGLNNDGEIVRLYDSHENLIDETPELEDDYNDYKTWQREPNGADNDNEEDWEFKKATKGISNDADVYEPEVELISPANEAFFEIDEVVFNFTATDDSSLTLNCTFYSDLDREFKAWASKIIDNAESSLFWANDIEDGNYTWKIECEDESGNTGESELRSFIIDEPDAPILNEIGNKTLSEGESLEFEISASDADSEDVLVYSANNVPENGVFNSADRIFTFNPDYTQAGDYEVEFIVTDGNLEDRETITITVTNLNINPVLEEIPELNIIEDEGKQKAADLNASDEDGSISEFRVKNENINQIDCSIEGNELYLESYENFFGIANCEIEVLDNENGKDSQIIIINIANVNDVPVIESFSPAFNPMIDEYGTQEFEITYNDIDSAANVNWYIDDELAGTGNSYLFTGNGEAKQYEVKVIVDDSELQAEKEWILLTSKIPIADNYNGNTTDFSDIEDLENVNLILEKTGKGKIEFLVPVNLSNIVDFDHYSNITTLAAGIDTNYLSALKNKPAKIIFYNLPYPKTPVIYYNTNFEFSGGNICPATICSNINYNAGVLSFDVTSFSVFIAGETRTCSQQTGFICSNNQICKGNSLIAADSDACCSIKCVEKPPQFEEDIDICEAITENLGVQIKSLGNNEEFKLGETIKFEVKITNPDEENADFDVEAYLFDSDENKVEDKAEDDLEIKGKDSEEVELELEIDEKLESEDSFAVFVKVKGENDNEYCNEAYKKIKIEREKDKVVIEDIEFDSDVGICGKYSVVSVEAKNIGEDDEDVYLTAENSELNISEKTDLFGLDSDDSEKREIQIKIPEDIESKEYEFKFSVNYNGDSEEETRSLSIKCEKSEKVVFEEEKENLNIIKEKIAKAIIDRETGGILLIASLAIGILIILILIVIVIKRR